MIAWALKNWSLCAIVGVLLLCGLLYLDGQHQRSLLSDSKLETANLVRDYALAQANASEEARQKQERFTADANAAAQKLLNTQRDLAQARKELSGRIANATAGMDSCLLPSAFVLLLNDSTGATASGMPAPTVSADPAPGGAAPGPSGPRLLPAAPLVNAKDLAAWVRDLAARMQRVEARHAALVDLLQKQE